MYNCGERASSFRQARVDHLLTAEHGEEEVPKEWHALPGKDLKMNSLKGQNNVYKNRVSDDAGPFKKGNQTCYVRVQTFEKKSGATNESRDKQLKNSAKEQSEK